MSIFWSRVGQEPPDSIIERCSFQKDSIHCVGDAVIVLKKNDDFVHGNVLEILGDETIVVDIGNDMQLRFPAELHCFVGKMGGRDHSRTPFENCSFIQPQPHRAPLSDAESPEITTDHDATTLNYESSDSTILSRSCMDMDKDVISSTATAPSATTITTATSPPPSLRSPVNHGSRLRRGSRTRAYSTRSSSSVHTDNTISDSECEVEEILQIDDLGNEHVTSISSVSSSPLAGNRRPKKRSRLTPAVLVELASTGASAVVNSGGGSSGGDAIADTGTAAAVTVTTPPFRLHKPLQEVGPFATLDCAELTNLALKVNELLHERPVGHKTCVRVLVIAMTQDM